MTEGILSTDMPKLNGLEARRVTTLPGSVYYVPNFISTSEEALLLSKDLPAEIPGQIEHAPVTRWTHLTHRRLQTYPSKLSQDNTLLAAPLPAWLTHPIIPRLQSLSIPVSSDYKEQRTPFSDSPHKTPNHVLVNEYRPGQGIMPHEDGAAYYPIVATVSLGAALVLDVYRKAAEGSREEAPVYRILQEARSLLITTGTMYTDHLHGIAEVTIDEDLRPETIANWDELGAPGDFALGKNDRATRTSLTYRDVLKVSNIGSKLKLFGKR